MAINLDTIERRARKAMQHAGHTVTIAGVVYACIPASMRDNELKNRDQTFRDDYKTSIALIVDDVSVSIGDAVTYRNVQRRVLDTGESGDGVQAVLHLGKLYGGR